MKNQLKQRAYRKTINSHGRVFFGDEKREIAVKNISTSGMLIQLKEGGLNVDNKHLLEDISPRQFINFCIPPLQLSGGAKIVRAFIAQDLQVFLGLEFQSLLSCGASMSCANNHSYRSSLAIPGRLLLHCDYFDFLTVNMSADDLIIRLPIIIGVEKGMVLAFEFPHANLKGWVKVLWTYDMEHFETLMGLQYVKPENEEGDAMARQADKFLPHAQDCPITHRLRIFAALRNKPFCDKEDKA